MKANGAKRKIFNDAIDLLDQMEEAAAVPENAVRMLSAESIRPFCGHPFRTVSYTHLTLPTIA